MRRIGAGWVGVAVLILLASVAVWAQQLPDAPKPQNNVPPPAQQQPLPEAPSTSKPAPPPNEAPPSIGGLPPSAPPANTPEPDPAVAPPGTPSDQITTVSPGSIPPGPGDPREQLFTLSKNVNFVMVPVSVKDPSGHLVEGLLSHEFSVYEDGQRQNISFFTSVPFPLSVAVVLDAALPSNTWNKVKSTLSSLVGAFSQYDEVAIFTYGNTVQKLQDFTAVDAAALAQSMRKVRTDTGKGYGPPVVGGPMAGMPTPTVNGRPLEPTVPNVQTMPKESYVLNDAILQAAQELARREQQQRARGIPPSRKVLFVISDGREQGSANAYADVLRVLLARQITVYAVGVGGGGIPGYQRAQRIHIPGLGYGDILPKYASATGGQVYSEVDQRAIEDAYARVTGEARNQYTIGYTTRATPSSAYRSIEVRVRRPNLKVYARDGYYPLPPGR